VLGSEISVSDAVSGQEIISLQGLPKGLRCVAFSPDDKLLAMADDKDQVWTWDVTTRKVVQIMDRRLDGLMVHIASLTFSADGKQLAAVAGKNTILIWNTDTGKVLHNLETLEGGCELTITFSHDGKRLASTHSGELDACLWDTATGQVCFIFRGATPITCLL